MNGTVACDVMVVGGGVAGIGAAVRAAKEGARTVLVEKNSYPGGIAVTGLHRFMCGLYAGIEGVPKQTLNGGVAEEICFRLKTLAPTTTPLRMGSVYVFPFATQNLVTVLQSLTEELEQLDVYYNTRAISVRTVNHTASVVTVSGPEGELDIHPRVVIDCSGDAVIVQLIGARCRTVPIRLRQFAGFTFRVKGLREVDDLMGVKVPYSLAQAVAREDLPFHLKFTTFTPGDAADEGYCKLSIPPSNDSSRNERARVDALRVHSYLSRVLPGFENSYIIEMSPEVVEREGPRVYGRYTLTAEDVLQGRRFADGAVKNAWPIELWDQEKGPCYQYLDARSYYEIPLRCLMPQNISNCFCAGRCISVSHEALGSTRVMGACISLGEAAGGEAVKALASCAS